MSGMNDLLSVKKPDRNDICQKHGPFLSHHLMGNIWQKCQKCTAELDAKKAEENIRRKREAEEAEWQARIGMAGIPERFRDRTLESYVATNPGQVRALEFAKAYAENFDEVKRTGKSALFIGKPGTGKNHLAIGIALKVMKDNSVLFTTIMRAIRRVKDTWGKSGESETQAINALVFPALLILDEVGVQFGSETEKLILFDILNERYERRKPTIILSNHEAHEVRGYLGDRIFDRLKEDGGEYIAFDWESYRGKA